MGSGEVASDAMSPSPSRPYSPTPHDSTNLRQNAKGSHATHTLVGKIAFF
jgi:hypothetical protein